MKTDPENFVRGHTGLQTNDKRVMPAMRILADVLAERIAQVDKWGQQDHPDGTGIDTVFHLVYKGCDAFTARRECAEAFREKRGTFAYFLWEEVAEALQESDPEKLRTELVQVAAVAVAWVEAIDRRSKTEREKAERESASREGER